MNENEQENIDSQNDEEEVVTSTENNEEETQEESQEGYTERERQLYARLKKEQEKRKEAEERAASTPAKEPEVQNTQQTNQEPVFTREEAILISQGFDEDDLETLHSIAKGKELTLKEAKEDALFVAYQEKKKAEAKQKEAQLGASSGSGRTTQQSVQPGMSDEDHKKVWRERMGS